LRDGVAAQAGGAGGCQVSNWQFVGLGFLYPARAAGIPL
jgi:hypothetical protein